MIVASEAPPPEPAEALPLAPAEAQSRTPSGSLRIFAVRRAGRTVVETLRQEGLARCSRPLPDSSRSGATRLVVSQLGPGFVRGDRFETYGELGAAADLTVAAQSAARYLGRGAASESHASWIVGPGAMLVLLNEPAIAYEGATHRSRVDVELASGASFAAIDTISPHQSFERVTTSLHVFCGGALSIHDRLELTPRRLGGEAFGTAVYVRNGMTTFAGARLCSELDEVARHLTDGTSLRIGIGIPQGGGLVVRARGVHLRDVRAILSVLLERAFALS